MRRIVEVGVGPVSYVNFTPGDIYLACDPFLNKMRESNIFREPKVTNAFFDSIAISDQDGEQLATYRYTHRNRKAFEGDRPNFGGNAYLCRSQRKKKRNWEIISVPCLTLDNWLKKYKEHGFLESIDLMVVSVPFGCSEIFSDFSFVVKPEIIAISSDDPIDVNLFQRHGYTVLLSEGVKQVIIRE